MALRQAPSKHGQGRLRFSGRPGRSTAAIRPVWLIIPGKMSIRAGHGKSRAGNSKDGTRLLWLDRLGERAIFTR
jgi:hypothetical protein